MQHQFSGPHHPQPNDILESIHFCLQKESLQDLQHQKLHWSKQRLHTIVQPARTDAKPSSYMSLPRKIPDVQDVGKPSEPVATELHIDSQVCRNGCKILSSKTTPVCPDNSKSGLEVKYTYICNWHANRKMKDLHYYNIRPRKANHFLHSPITPRACWNTTECCVFQ